MKGIKRERGHGKHRKTKGSLVKSNMRGGSLTRFRTDEWYVQHGNGLMMDTVRGGLSKALKGPEIL